MKHMFKFFLPLLIAIFFFKQTNANGITVSNVTVLPNTSQIQFDVTWENSWRSDVLQNWDAAWVFMKYKDVDGSWKHLQFTNTNNIVPTGFASNVTSDNNGAFLYRSASGSGTANITGAKLGIPSQFALGVYDIKVFGIEMVYIPTGAFWVGDHKTSVNSYTSNSLSTTPALIDVAKWVYDPYSGGDIDFSTLPLYPVGFNNFYCMKYEISQGAYRDFLNSLQYLQQTFHTANAPNSIAGTNALSNSATGRPYIEIVTPGVSLTTPAVYGCDANNNNLFNEPNDGEWVACNYLNWPDLAAYLAWACLAPMTELQFEKICRGPIQPIAGEYAWGTAQVSSNIYSLTNSGFSNESISNLSSAPNEGNSSYITTNSAVSGPLRNGIFATATSNRISSGGSFYGVMDMNGSMWERVITSGSFIGRNFEGNNGAGAITSNGYAAQITWPAGILIDGTQIAFGLMYRGGSSHWPASNMRVSDRSILETGTATTRFIDQGGRGVRN